MSLPTDALARKNIPVYSGFIKYFPDAIVEVAKLSKVGNDQHNPGQPLHWAKEKSSDELDALMRHMIDEASGVPVDTDGIDHAVKVAWRAMANLQRMLDKRNTVLKDNGCYVHLNVKKGPAWEGTFKAGEVLHVANDADVTDAVGVLTPTSD